MPVHCSVRVVLAVLTSLILVSVSSACTACGRAIASAAAARPDSAARRCTSASGALCACATTRAGRPCRGHLNGVGDRCRVQLLAGRTGNAVMIQDEGKRDLNHLMHSRSYPRWKHFATLGPSQLPSCQRSSHSKLIVQGQIASCSRSRSRSSLAGQGMPSKRQREEACWVCGHFHDVRCFAPLPAKTRRSLCIVYARSDSYCVSLVD